MGYRKVGHFSGDWAIFQNTLGYHHGCGLEFGHEFGGKTSRLCHFVAATLAVASSVR
jgi:hypothetical protein